MNRPTIAAALLAPVLLAPVLLAACGPQPTTVEVAATPAIAENTQTDYVARLRAMPAGQRNATLMRAIRDANNDCQGVAESTEVENPGGPATWTARCDGGGEWVVAITDAGDATVTDRSSLGNAPTGAPQAR